MALYGAGGIRGAGDVRADEFGPLCEMCHLIATCGIGVFDNVRRAFGDHFPDKEKDWLRPLLASQYAWAESVHRRNLQLPQADDLSDKQALEGSLLLNFVHDAAQHPLHEWEQEMGKGFPWQ